MNFTPSAFMAASNFGIVDGPMPWSSSICAFVYLPKSDTFKIFAFTNARRAGAPSPIAFQTPSLTSMLTILTDNPRGWFGVCLGNRQG